LPPPRLCRGGGNGESRRSIKAPSAYKKISVSVDHRVKVLKRGQKSLGTGSKVTVCNETYEVVVKGDTGGDGFIDIFDLISLMDHVNGDSTIEP